MTPPPPKVRKYRIGSLFSGVAGLDRAVEQHFGAEVAWLVEFDKAPSKVLAHHYPGVPNYREQTITAPVTSAGAVPLEKEGIHFGRHET